jgi:multiple sugar transport system substrate-binding protein
MTLLLALACTRSSSTGTVITFPASAVGAEATVLRRQIARFEAQHPGVTVVQRPTPDAADQRHQLYVQWLNARASEPDILQLDVIWTPEFAAAGWILPLDRFRPPVDSFFPATIRANTWDGRLYALPWFVDVGMLYWRTDLLNHPPASLDELVRQAETVDGTGGVTMGFVWQGARYEGLVTVFLEVLGGFGGAILGSSGRVTVDAEPGVRALSFLRDALQATRISPPAVLAWQEEQVRFAFQNGSAVFMRNWPYAFPLMEDSSQSRIAGRFAVAPMPAGPGGAPTAALGGSQLAINAHSRHPDLAYALIAYLTGPAQMLERALVAGQYPTRPEVYGDSTLRRALAIPPEQVRALVERAVPRPVTPVYTELSEILQIWLHRALTGQTTPTDALHRAAQEMQDLLTRVGLGPEAAHVQ